MTGWFREFIPNYAMLTVSLTESLKEEQGVAVDGGDGERV